LSTKAAIIDDYFGTSFGRVIEEEAAKAGLSLQAACALVEQESAGKNIFGCDHGATGDAPPYCRQPVTRERVQRLIASPHMNGIGLTQLTWWEFVNQAEAMGGAHIARYQCRVGFALLASYFDKYGEPDGWGAYNAGAANRASVRATYSASCMRRRDAWRTRLAATQPKPPEPKPPPNPSAVPAVGPTTYGISVVEGGKTRAARMYSPFNHYRPGAPAQIYHKGEDIECPPMVPQYALFDGVVQAVWDYDSVGGYHQAILLFYPELGIYDLHGHIAAGVSKWYRAGTTFKRGDIIARGGTVYDAMGTAPHLHGQCSYNRSAAFALGSAFNDAAVDPATHLRAKAKPFPRAPNAAGLIGAAVEMVKDAAGSTPELRCGDQGDVSPKPAFELATSYLDPDGEPTSARRMR
jgi:murein DD-endopeptidase MepM/ murein hydrolase activator NlpD